MNGMFDGLGTYLTIVAAFIAAVAAVIGLVGGWLIWG